MGVTEPYKDVLAALLETFFPVLDPYNYQNSFCTDTCSAASLQLPIHSIPEVVDEVSTTPPWMSKIPTMICYSL